MSKIIDAGLDTKIFNLYSEMLKMIAKNSHKFDEKAVLTGFLPLKGKNYSNDLMVIGRAVNGWVNINNLADCIDDNKRQEIIENIYEESKGTGINCPLEWVINMWGNKNPNEYNSAKSAFWRVIKQICIEMNIGQNDFNNWPSYLIWSNLYKISFETGNPSSMLADLQFCYCVDILKREIEIWEPRSILLLTGINWADAFIQRLGRKTATVDTSNKKLVEGAFIINNSTKVVVAKHPQGKPETDWINEVMAEFKRLQ